MGSVVVTEECAAGEEMPADVLCARDGGGVYASDIHILEETVMLSSS